MSRDNPYKLFAVYSSIIFILPATLLGGYLLGNWIDDYLLTYPWLTYLGLFLGGATGFKQMFQLLNRASAGSEGENKEEKE